MNDLPLYTSNYANLIGKMHNSEITGLAKNRFTDAETMLAISKHHYRLGKEYLANNPNITPEAAQELWDHRGYVFKATLLSNGAIKLKKKEYAEVYRKYFKNNRRSHLAHDAGILRRLPLALSGKSPGKRRTILRRTA